MSRKKLILSIFLMAALVSVGIILPALHRDQDSRKPEGKNPIPTTEKLIKMELITIQLITQRR